MGAVAVRDRSRGQQQPADLLGGEGRGDSDLVSYNHPSQDGAEEGLLEDLAVDGPPEFRGAARPRGPQRPADDQMTSSVFTGRAGARIKGLICAGAAWSVSHPTMMLPSRRHLLVVVETEPRPVTL
ncbi:hypothetical protein [Streptomyces sp. NPDC055134]